MFGADSNTTDTMGKRAKTAVNTYFCEKCNKEFKLRSSFRVHMNKHEGKQYSCDECGKTYTASYSLKVHKRSHSNEKPYQCSFCSVRFSQKSHCQRHERSHAARSRGNDEGVVAKKETGFGSSQQTANISRDCSVCGCQFQTVEEFKVHLQSHQHHKKSQEQQLDYSCNVCDAVFTNRNTYRRHQKEHITLDGANENVKTTEVRKKQKALVVCKVCGQIFSSMSSFRVHKNKHLGKRYYCTRCAKSFTTTDQLQVHERSHDNKRSFECSQCNAKFNRKSNLSRHILLHDGIKRYVCHVCGKAFVLNESLTTHLKVHQVGPLFSCDICGAKFKHENNVKHHKKIHSNVKEFKCCICSREFLRKRTLKDHLKVHEKGSDRVSLFTAPVEFCSLCSKGFANSNGLKRHMKKHQLGKLKQYNKACGQVDNIRPDETITAEREKHPNSSIHPRRVLVDERLVDNGQLYIKIDPSCFTEVTASSKLTGGDRIEIKGKRSESEVDLEMSGNSVSCYGDEKNCYQKMEKQLGNCSAGSENEVEEIGLESNLALSKKVSTITEKKDDVEMSAEYSDHDDSEDVLMNGELEDEIKQSDETEQGNSTYVSENVTPQLLNNDQSNDGNIFDDTNFDRVEENCENLSSEVSDIIEDLENDNVINRIINTEQFEKSNTKAEITEAEDDMFESRITQLSQDEGTRDVEHAKAKDNCDIGSSQDNCDIGSSQGDKDKSKGFLCAFCDRTKSFKNKKSLISHLKKIHKEKVSEKFQCPECSKMFLIKTDLEEHLEKYKNDLTHFADTENLECMFCLTKYSSKASLKVHLQRYHKNDDFQTYRCDHCDKMFASRILYKNHVDSHMFGRLKSKGKCACEICGAEFNTRCSLRRHKRVVHRIEEDEEFEIEYENETSTEEQIAAENQTLGEIRERVNVFEEIHETQPMGDFEQENCYSIKSSNLQLSKDAIQELDNTSQEVRQNLVKDNNNSEYVNTVNTFSPSSEINADKIPIDGLETDKVGGDLKLNEKLNKIEISSVRTAVDFESEVAWELKHGLLNDSKQSDTLPKRRFRRKFRCTTCRKSFHMMSTLKQHMSGHGKQEGETAESFSCEQCNKTFSKLTHLMIHTHKVHNKFVQDCSYCPRKFMTVSSLKTHIYLKHRKNLNGSRQKCHENTENNDGSRKTYCSNDSQILKNGSVDRQLLVCSICDVSFSLQCNLKRHCRLKHSDSSRTKTVVRDSEACKMCDKCGNWFKTSKFRQHMNSKECKKALQCEVCGQAFRTDSLLKVHTKEVHNIKSYVCDKCPKIFSSYSNLTRHKSIKHSGSNSSNDLLRNYMCSICGKCFTAKDSLRVHMFTHSGERPYKCSLCDASYTQSGHLHRHIKVTHEGKFDYQCQYTGCDKSFYDLSSLRIHQRSHTDERPYACPNCPQRFRTSNAKKTHMKTHLLNKEFECHICFQGLTTKHSLQMHLKRHEVAEKMNPNSSLYDPNFKANVRQKVVKKMEEKRFACSYCSRKFTTTRGMYAHQRSVCEGKKQTAVNALQSPT